VARPTAHTSTSIRVDVDLKCSQDPPQGAGESGLVLTSLAQLLQLLLKEKYQMGDSKNSFICGSPQNQLTGVRRGKRSGKNRSRGSSSSISTLALRGQPVDRRLGLVGVMVPGWQRMRRGAASEGLTSSDQM
jgi:hypothetical protein